MRLFDALLQYLSISTPILVPNERAFQELPARSLSIKTGQTVIDI